MHFRNFLCHFSNISTSFCFFKWTNQNWWINQIKLANQSVQRSTCDRHNKDNNINSCFWKQKISWLFKESRNVFYKRHMKGKNVFLHWILLHTSENQTFQRAERFVMTHFIQNGLSERYSFISKVNKILKLNILKSLLAIGYWCRDKGGTGWVCPSMSICLLLFLLFFFYLHNNQSAHCFI